MLSVVIPAYNEEGRLERTLEKLQNFLKSRPGGFEVVVVDDGSSDGTAAMAENYGCRVIRHPCNLGKGAAVKTGVLVSKGDTVLVTDADLAAPVTELPKLEAVLERGADIAIGSREAPGAVVKRAGFKRKLAGKVFNLMVRLLTGLPYRDTQCGFKLFTREAADVLFSLARCEGYAFDVEVLLLARESGFKVGEVGVAWRDMPGSKVRLLRDGRRMFRELWDIRRSIYQAKAGTSAPGGVFSPALSPGACRRGA